MEKLELKALMFARKHHEAVKQVRKYTGEPYIVHPIAVAATVRTVAHTSEMVMAAYLHDVLEDTLATADEVEVEFGTKVRLLVEELTDVSKPGDGNRAVRKEKDRLHLAGASADAKTVKLADLIDNSKSILSYDREFAKTYLAEKRELLKVLKEGNAELWDIAHSFAHTGV